MLANLRDGCSNATVEDDFAQAYTRAAVHRDGRAAPGGTGARNALPAAHGDGQRAHASGPARRQRSHQQLQGGVSPQAGADSLSHEGPGAAADRGAARRQREHGGDTASKSSPVAVEKALVSAGIRLFAFLVVDYPGLRRVPEELYGPDDFLQLVQATGGSTLQLNATRRSEPRYPVEERDRLALGAVTGQLYLQMAQFYRLEVDLPEPVNKRRGWKLEMVNERGAKMKEWQVAYQATLLPCESTTERSKENK